MATETRFRIERSADMAFLQALSDTVLDVAGYRDIEPGVLLSVVKTGGYAGGAFDESGRCIAALYGLIGLRDGTPYLHSEMLAVLPQYQRMGLARAMKLDQRDFALERGMDLVTWTFDPLRGVNASLNIRRLGVSVAGYVEDMYGSLPGFSSGWPTDQLLIEWWVRSERAKRAICGHGDALFATMNVPSVTTTRLRHDGLLVLEDVDLDLDEPYLRVEIPESIQQMRSIEMDAVLAWRYGIRNAFQTYLARGYHVEWFLTEPGQPRRNFYVLQRTSDGGNFDA